jgi:hypothetical protein
MIAVPNRLTLGSTLNMGGLWFLDNRILWTPNGNASNSVDSQQRLEELPKSLESIGFIANRFG